MLLRITTTFPARNQGHNVWFPFDARAHATLDDVWDALETVGAIRGDRIDTEIRSGVRVVTARTPCILGRGAIALIVPLQIDVIDRDGEPLA
jgi:hypothetical protein